MDGHIKAFKSVSTITLFSIISFVLSVFLQIIIAAKFGARMEMDAYLLSLALPTIITVLLLSTSQAIFVPFLKDIELTNSKTEQGKLISTVFNLFFLVLFILSFFLVVFAPLIIRLMAISFSPDKQRLAVVLFRIMIPSIIFGGLSGFMTSIYHAREEFSRPAFMLAVNNAVMILVFFFLFPLLKIKALALGLLLGSITQFFILFPIMVKKVGYSFSLNLRDNKLFVLGPRFMHLLIGGGLFGLIIPIERTLASRLPEGSISYLGYAAKIFTLILFLPTAAIPKVLLPNLSRYFSTQNLTKLRDNLALGIKVTFFIIFPISVLLFIFRIPVIYIFLQRGNFDSLATISVAKALVCYLGVLLGVSLAGIAGAGFCAIKKTSIVAVMMAATVLFYILFAVPLSRSYSYIGLALAQSIAILASTALDFVILRYLMKGIKGKSILIAFLKIFVSSLVMGIAIWFFHNRLYVPFIFNDKLTLFLKISISSLFGFFIYTSLCFILKLEEITIISNSIFAKIFKSKRRLREI